MVWSVICVVVNINIDVDFVMEVMIDYGRWIFVRKVFVVIGVFMVFRNLLEVEVYLDIKLFFFVVIKFEISEEDVEKIKYVFGLIYIWNLKYCVIWIICIIDFFFFFRMMLFVFYFGKGGDDWNKDYFVDFWVFVVFYMFFLICYFDGIL